MSVSNSEITAIVLGAGLGLRMKSSKPKVLHNAAGRSLIDHVLTNLFGAGVAQARVIVGYGADSVKQHLWGRSGVDCYIQEKQLGTADAVKAADIATLRGTVLICNGDHPLIRTEDYTKALQDFNSSRADIVVISAKVKNPTGYGRILREKSGELKGIIEEKDADPAEKKISEVNSGLYVLKANILKELLPLIKNQNAKKEFYLTDIITLALEAEKKVEVSLAKTPFVCQGVNTQVDLARASQILFRRKARELMNSGVVFIDPFTTYVDGDVSIEAETVIGPGCVISAGTEIGKNCQIEAYCQIRASKIHDGVELRWGSVVDQSQIHEAAIVGPYARLRPESIVEREAHVGNFVEMKKTRLGARAKANHLTYLGDADVGEATNIGCGTITCNYAVDRKKYKTTIGKNVFVGSDTQFVAPVTIGDGAVIASGSTVTKDVPANALAVARSRQFTKPNYNKGPKDPCAE